MSDIKINVIEQTPGKHIKYALTSTKIIFGDDELSINLAQRERDYEVMLDICIDVEGGIVIGTGGSARLYAAQIIIPARRYDTIDDGYEIDGTKKYKIVPVPFDISLCTLILWGLEEL